MFLQSRTRDLIARHGLGYVPQTCALDLASEVGEVAEALLQTIDYGRPPQESDPALTERLGHAFYALVALSDALKTYRARLHAQGRTGSAHCPET